VTQQYIAGEFSSLLGDLERAAEPWHRGIHGLRLEVERSPLPTLPELASEALELTDEICLATLEHGDLNGFSASARVAATLGEFANCAGLARR
jgi:hypothetical protein